MTNGYNESSEFQELEAGDELQRVYESCVYQDRARNIQNFSGVLAVEICDSLFKHQGKSAHWGKIRNKYLDKLYRVDKVDVKDSSILSSDEKAVNGYAREIIFNTINTFNTYQDIDQRFLAENLLESINNKLSSNESPEVRSNLAGASYQGFFLPEEFSQDRREILSLSLQDIEHQRIDQSAKSIEKLFTQFREDLNKNTELEEHNKIKQFKEVDLEQIEYKNKAESYIRTLIGIGISIALIKIEIDSINRAMTIAKNKNRLSLYGEEICEATIESLNSLKKELGININTRADTEIVEDVVKTVTDNSKAGIDYISEMQINYSTQNSTQTGKSGK